MFDLCIFNFVREFVNLCLSKFLSICLCDALLSSLLDPLEGLNMLNCGKLELGGHSQLPALKGVRGAC
jgi:hypothetical protein